MEQMTCKKQRRAICKKIEERLRDYYKSRLTLEQLGQRVEALRTQREELKQQLSELEKTADGHGTHAAAENAVRAARARLLETSAQILMYQEHIVFIQNEFFALEHALGALDEREREIIRLRYKQKASYIAIGQRIYLSPARTHEVRTAVLLKLHEAA